MESDDGTNRHPELFGIVNATYKKYTGGVDDEDVKSRENRPEEGERVVKTSYLARAFRDLVASRSLGSV